jgi:flavin reductase (DIM6/NTAB) family NADH-FMN oxidoreductase RutF
VSPDPATVTLPGRAEQLDPDSFWHTVRRFPTGVSIVTTGSGRQARGSTVSTFTFISRNPALISVCLHEDSSSLRVIQRTGGFAVNVLAADHAALARRFAAPRRESGWQQFDTEWVRGVGPDPPWLRTALCWLWCRSWRYVLAGDHVLVLANVTRAADGVGTPLLYLAGQLRPAETSGDPT